MTIGTMRVKITMADGEVWYASSPITCNRTPEGMVNYLNKVSKRRGVRATYELATEAEYQAYRRLGVNVVVEVKSADHV